MEESDPAVRHDFLRILFATMLLRWPADWIRGFWRGHMSRLAGLPGEEMALYNFLWKKNAQLPAASLYRVFDSLESFCRDRGISAEELLDGMLWHAPTGIFIPGDTILPWLNPVRPDVFADWDPRVPVLKFLHLYTGNYFKGHIRHMVKSQCADGWIRFYSIYITDPTFRNPILFDCHLAAGSFLRNSPRMFGLPPFDSISLLADCRPIQQVAGPQAQVRIAGNEVFVDGARVGHTESFSSFLGRHGLDLREYGLPEREVVCVAPDHTEPGRARPLLRPGCAYGAPLYAQTLEFRRLEPESIAEPEEALRGFRAQALSEWQRAEKLFAGFLDASRPLARFKYLSSEETIELNGEFLARSVPAKILRYILREHTREGRERFLHREFKRDPDITYNPSNPNFEVRLRRVAEKLTGKMPALRMVKADKGAFLFKSECRIEFIEQ